MCLQISFAKTSLWQSQSFILPIRTTIRNLHQHHSLKSTNQVPKNGRPTKQKYSQDHPSSHLMVLNNTDSPFPAVTQRHGDSTMSQDSSGRTTQAHPLGRVLIYPPSRTIRLHPTRPNLRPMAHGSTMTNVPDALYILMDASFRPSRTPPTLRPTSPPMIS